MAVQFYQMAHEISSEAKNEMNCDSESGSTALIRVKIIRAGAEGFPLLRVTSLQRGTASPIEANKAALSCLTQGSSVRAGLIGPTTCPGLSYYHLRGMVKGSKSWPLVCYPFLNLFIVGLVCVRSRERRVGGILLFRLLAPYGGNIIHLFLLIGWNWFFPPPRTFLRCRITLFET